MYGRIVHLEPVHWVNDWPMVGEVLDGDGIGEPVARHLKPRVAKSYPMYEPQTHDEFDSSRLGEQWQWESNPDSSWFSCAKRPGWLRLYSQALSGGNTNLWNAGWIIGQKIPAPSLLVTTKIDADSLSQRSVAGLVVLGLDYSFIAIKKTEIGFQIRQSVHPDAENAQSKTDSVESRIAGGKGYLQLEVKDTGLCRFRYSLDGLKFIEVGKEFRAKAGKWVGARIGLFSERSNDSVRPGFADFDWIHFAPLK